MPVEPNALGDRMQIVYVDAEDPSSTVSRSYSNVKEDASDEAVYDVAEGLASLSKDTLDDVIRHKSYLLIKL